jgi:hypothetical protein
MCNQSEQLSVLKKGSSVKLIEKPEGCLSQYYPLTAGCVYTFLGWMGSCVVLSTDVEGQTASVHHSRIKCV